VLLETLQKARPLMVELDSILKRCASELRIMQAAARYHQRFGRAALPNHIISRLMPVSDMLELALMLNRSTCSKEATHCISHYPAVRDHRRPAQFCALSWTSLFAIPYYRQLAGEPGQHSGSHAGLFRQQQGWRLHHG